MTDHMIDSTLSELERYYDTVPRVGGARAEDFGPLTLFVQEGAGWQYYARPALDAGGGPGASAADVERVLARQRELKVPESFEWVAENSPSLRAAVEAAGLHVHAHPLMVLDPAAVPTPAHPEVRLFGADDPLLTAAVTVPALAFADPGTAVGEAGPAELAAATAAPEAAERRARVSGMLASGRTAMAAAVRDGVVLCSGQYNPVGDVAEVVGVGTLPSARRQGLALGVTAALVAQALERGARTVFLSAGDEDVARVYGRIGFRRVATALIAEPPA
ncbi:GNAT family N-acetyltransferase [Streptomyces sp. NBC_00555]|uniref:GNAT family N-acetyltransferase n=1 Tax=unclassified Streptomyces TaxID=2593676 RepID=UPI00224F443F|nr:MULTISPECIES: GNAT family N-acetyltransferase [unclassified Streptomyces]MCX5014017.1 GNAT family N-acetyltransferase [Streptomyces sp. NBC_00555]MCX5608036.1 GNAT family N-acetyltransferase [Streptomyces sp. NBC_00047]